MANYERTLKSCIWSDAKFEEMTQTEKLFYILIHCGEESSDVSLFHLSIKRIAYHLGITVEEVKALIKKFTEMDLIQYNETNQEILVIDYMYHNPCRGGLKYENYLKDLKKIKSIELLERLVEVAKNYPVTIGFLSALSEFVDLDPEDYEIKKTNEDINSVKTAAQRGRNKIQENRKIDLDISCDDGPDYLPF